MLFVVSDPTQFREALTLLAYLEGSGKAFSATDECDALEAALSRYVASSEGKFRNAYDNGPNEHLQNITGTGFRDCTLGHS